MPKVNNRNTAIDYLNRDIVNIKNELKEISKIVRDGNGQPPLTQQVATITNDLKHLTEELKIKLDEIKEANCRNHEEAVERSKVSWQFKSAIWVAVISGITSIIMHFFK